MEKEPEASEEISKAVESDEAPLITLAYFRGLPFPASLISSDVLDKVVDFKPGPGDIFVVSYPKCGCTWTQYIIWEIINRGTPPPNLNQMMFKEFPFLEVTGVDILHDMSSPRLMKIHLPFDLRPNHPLARYIYVARNPWDCCVSFYHQIKEIHFPNKELLFETFFDFFLEGKVPFGNFFDHILHWYQHKNDSNVLFLTYENMSADRRETMLTVAKFLGDHHYEALKNDEEMFRNCLKYSEFNYLKERDDSFITKNSNSASVESRNFFKENIGSVGKDIVDMKKFRKWDFFRKGVVGDWKNYFTRSQIRRLNECMSDKLKDTELLDTWTQKL